MYQALIAALTEAVREYRRVRRLQRLRAYLQTPFD
jgi:hypothetical protein